MDWLEMPQLRQKSFAFVRTGLLAKIRARAKFTREEIIYNVYGILALVFSALMVVVALYIWESELKMMLRHLMAKQDLLAVALLFGLTLSAGMSLLLGLVSRALLFAAKARNR